MMEINKSIYSELDKLDENQKIEFCIFCAERTIELYKDFDLVVNNESLNKLIEDADGYTVLREALDYAKSNLFNDNVEDDKIEYYINLCAKLMPDYDEYGGDYETIVAQYIPRTIGFIFEYCNRKENRFAHWCSDDNIEILNAICSFQYRNTHTTINPNEIRSYIVSYYLHEVKVQSQFIDMLRNSVEHSVLMEFTNNNLISLDNLSHEILS